MKPYQERVVTEKSELDEKIAKLKPFMESETYKELYADEQERLARQFALMTQYSEVLAERIGEF